MAKWRVSGLKPYSVIQHPTTGVYYMVGNGYFTLGTHCVNKIDLLPITDIGSSKDRIPELPSQVNIYDQHVVSNEMRLQSGRQYGVDCNFVDFSKTFGMSLEPTESEDNPAKHLFVNLIGIAEKKNVTGKILKVHEQTNGYSIQPFSDEYDMALLRRGRASSRLAFDKNVLPISTKKAEESGKEIPQAAPETPPAKRQLKIDLTGTRYRPRSDGSTPAAPKALKPEKEKPVKITGLDDLVSLFAGKSGEAVETTEPTTTSSKLDPSQLTLPDAAKRVKYSLSDLATAVIAGDAIMGNPQWQLKDSAPKNSPFRGQSLNLQDVFDLFANENISAKDISKSIHFAGPKVAEEIVTMINDPQFRSQFDIK